MQAVFDDPNRVSSAGLAPAMALAESAKLGPLAMHHLTVPTDKGASAALKISSIVAGMVAGADCIDDMGVVAARRHGQGLQQHLCAVDVGVVPADVHLQTPRQLDAVASRFLTNLTEQAPVVAGTANYALVDVDDTIIKVHGHAKQGAGFGYSGVRGINALLATVSTDQAAPVIVAQRLRQGPAASPRGAKRLVADALAQVKRLRGQQASSDRVLVRADSAFYNHKTAGAALAAGAEVSVKVRMNPPIKTAIDTIDDDAWTPIEYPDAVFDEDTNRWISQAEVAEVPYTAFGSKPRAQQVSGRLVVRQIPELNPTRHQTLFQYYRYHAFLTTTDPEVVDIVTADKTTPSRQCGQASPNAGLL